MSKNPFSSGRIMRVQVANGIRVVRQKIVPINPSLIFFVIVFNQDVRPINIVNNKNGSSIILGWFRGLQPQKVGFIGFPVDINTNTSCIQVEPVYTNNGRMYTLIKGYLHFTKPLYTNQKSG